MSDVAIEVNDLCKSFGDISAVDNISFSVKRGEVAGFIGANGAGKTTTMRMMATLEVADAGEVRIEGRSIDQSYQRVREKLGWMPDAYGAYENMTVLEYLDFFGRAYGYKGKDLTSRLDEVMHFAELHELTERPMNKLSKGMSQRLCLGRTLLHDPGVLLLDEPAAGLDPKARIEFKHLVRLLAEDGKTLLISSHILSELEEMCDNLLFIDEGRIVHHGSSQSLKSLRQGATFIRIEVESDVARLAQWAETYPDVKVFEVLKQGVRLEVPVADNEWLARMLKAAVKAGISVCSFSREEQRLEDAFVAMLERKAAANYE